jgi:hypothetical protein
MSADKDDLRWKIEEAKRRRLPLPQLLEKLGLAAHAKKSARCPFPGHDDKHPSFSVFQEKDGFWHWKCFTGDGEGDEISFLMRWKGLSIIQAINFYLDMAGFPASRLYKSHKYPDSREYPKSRESRAFPESLESPECPVSPVSSNGQGIEKELRELAARNACTERNTARERRWKLVRDLRAIEKEIGQELTMDELMVAFDEWHRLSQRFLDPAKTRDAYLAAFLAELRKVRVPTGEGNTFNKALEAVSKLAPSELPTIAGMPDAPESWRRLLALHCELSRRSTRKNKTYFLSYRDAAKAHQSLSHQLAYDITLAFERLGVIQIVNKGKAGLESGKAAEFRYLLSQPGDEESLSENRDGTESSPAICR